MYQVYPSVKDVRINDPFWTPYLQKIRTATLPYVFKKLEENGYLQNFISVANKDGAKHLGPPYSDGHILQSLRGACDFLAADRDPILEAYVDRVIDILSAASEAEGGFLCTATTQEYPEQRWGDKGGDIVFQHDLYNHGTLIEAAISHYKATQKTTLLLPAIKAANLICDTMGPPPKRNIIPGHSLPEEAFVKLYGLFRDDSSLHGFAQENGVEPGRYLDMAEFWYEARGDHRGRFLAKDFSPQYNQDHVTFAEQREAVGHSVRAMLCYLGATAVAREKDRQDYFDTLRGLWDNVTSKKLHVSGGIGSRHDIEGFDVDYHLPNGAYLETCAAISLAFWNAEMNLVDCDAKYFDCFERSLYNNVMSAVGEDFTHFFYQNPLQSDGALRRWEWHRCPCCPPMLLKIFSCLNTFIYSYSGSERTVNVNMLIGSSYENELFSIEQTKCQITVDSKGEPLTVRIRIPEYLEQFTLNCDGAPVSYEYRNGYAVVKQIWRRNCPLTLSYETPIRRIYANPKVDADLGRVAVMRGPFVYCAEGVDNGGNVDLEWAEEPQLAQDGDFIRGKASNGNDISLLPYYRWCNRGEGETDRKMAVWLKQEHMLDTQALANKIQERLYDIYE
ncbi:MAG: glycoside hydrolase family 127 protein [Clostridia bacterium]|nr:glycoside hydrolase family 127 protein [Clostridia bacterium]